MKRGRRRGSAKRKRVQRRPPQSMINKLAGEESIDQLKDEFIGKVSHELRTPLSIIKEGINLLLDGIPGDLNDAQIAVLKSAKASAERLARMINDLLDLSRSGGGRPLKRG